MLHRSSSCHQPHHQHPLFLSEKHHHPLLFQYGPTKSIGIHLASQLRGAKGEQMSFISMNNHTQFLQLMQPSNFDQLTLISSI